MKKATCRQLKGACDTIITGRSPEEMAENSKAHAMEMLQKGDSSHIAAMEDMKKLTSEEFQEWYKNFVKDFDSLEEM